MSRTTGRRNDKIAGFMSSLLLHAAFMLAGGFVFAKPVQYGIQAGSGGMEVSLTVAPAEPEAPVEVVVAPKLSEIFQDKSDIVDPIEAPLPQYSIEEQRPAKTIEDKKRLTAVDPAHTGDGSSSVPGKDKTTFYSAGGAITEAKPNYLRNPAPPYPWEARQKGWQGVVILKVIVDRSGNPKNVEKEKGSGYAILDESALKTVKQWRFHPAQYGALPVESLVRVPVRFELENLKQRSN
jgi:protein TonB